MKRNSKWNWLVALTAIAIFSIFSAGDAQAWGPLSHSAIAQAAQDTEGMPQTTHGPNFVSESTMPKVFEYTDQSYAKLSYDFTDIMADNVQGMTDYCQVLSWGASQTAEKVGDEQFLHDISRDTFERWVNELLCDSLLLSIESPYYGTGSAEVAVMPKLVSDATVEYTDSFEGAPISGMETVLAAHFQAHVLLGELAVINNENFQKNARRAIDTAAWVNAMDQSVAAAVEYVITSTQPQTGTNWMVGDASQWGSLLLGKIGSLLVATGDGSIANQHSLGIYSYRVDLTTERVNEITVTFLHNVSRNLSEHPIVRQMAVTLYNLMTEPEFGFSYGGEAPPSFGPYSLAE